MIITFLQEEMIAGILGSPEEKTAVAPLQEEEITVDIILVIQEEAIPATRIGATQETHHQDPISQDQEEIPTGVIHPDRGVLQVPGDLHHQEVPQAPEVLPAAEVLHHRNLQADPEEKGN